MHNIAINIFTFIYNLVFVNNTSQNLFPILNTILHFKFATSEDFTIVIMAFDLERFGPMGRLVGRGRLESREVDSEGTHFLEGQYMRWAIYQYGEEWNPGKEGVLMTWKMEGALGRRYELTGTHTTLDMEDATFRGFRCEGILMKWKASSSINNPIQIDATVDEWKYVGH